MQEQGYSLVCYRLLGTRRKMALQNHLALRQKSHHCIVLYWKFRSSYFWRVVMTILVLSLAKGTFQRTLNADTPERGGQEQTFQSNSGSLSRHHIIYYGELLPMTFCWPLFWEILNTAYSFVLTVHRSLLLIWKKYMFYNIQSSDNFNAIETYCLNEAIQMRNSCQWC